MTTKKVAKIEVIKPGSNPDIDSDFNTLIRDSVLEHVAELYGRDNVANIITFNSLAAKSAFKIMCTIYQIPFASANKIVSLVPQPIEGVDCTIADIFNPKSDRYAEGKDFRQATSGERWEKVIAGARAIEGRYRSTGVHPCFTGDTLVKTSKGFIPIAKIKEGQLVLTHTGSYKKVVRTMKNSTDTLFKLHAENSLITEVTGNHPFYVREVKNDNMGYTISSPEWKPADQLVPDLDFIGTPVNIKNEIPKNVYNLPFRVPSFWWLAGWIAGYKPFDYSELKYDDPFRYFEKFNVKNSIPEEVLSLPEELLKSFLEGYLSLTATYDEQENNYVLCVSNKKLALNLIAAINKAFKIPCNVTLKCRCNVVDASVSYEDQYCIQFNGARRSESNSFYEAGYVWSKVTQNEEVNKTADTYNLSVIDDNSYTANGLAAHNCGIIMSSKPLSSVIPLQVRQDDGRVISQWTYSECEDVGLIKFDFLGLDTVDLIQHTVEYVGKGGKEPPNMLDIIHGPMDDKKTYEMLAKGETTGIFQLGSQIVRDFLRLMKPTEFEDIAASTALMRPGPMGMTSHVRYANRKNGDEPITAIHPDFVGSPLETILEKTQGLVVYQESILRISNEIAGLTLQEGDDLRSAMGKKKMSVMLAIRPKFFDGARKNGYSDDAIEALWNTIEEFGKYGFNRSHSIAYSMNAYQTAYLKAHYPVEFMAALVAQNVDNKEKILTFLQEARKMRLKVGSVDINISDVEVAPDYTGESEFDIVYGISGVNAVSKEMAGIIVKERESHGKYKSVQNLINRCSPLGVTNRKIYENLALAGAFDSFEINRRAIVESLSSMLGEAKTKKTMGASLFDAFGDDEMDATMDLSSIDEYPFVEKLQKEANVIGLYLTDHPLSRAGVGLSAAGVVPISKVLDYNTKATVTIVGSLTEVESKIHKRGGKSIKVTIDDNTSYITANVSKNIVKGIDKGIAQERIRRFYTRGDLEVPSDIEEIALNEKFEMIESIEKNNIYIMRLTFRPAYGNGHYGALISEIKPLILSHSGVLPVRIRVDEKHGKKGLRDRVLTFAEKVSEKHPGQYPLYASIITDENRHIMASDKPYYAGLVNDIRTTKTSEEDDNSGDSANIFTTKKIEKIKKNTQIIRELPPVDYTKENSRKVTEDELSEVIEYFDTGFKVAKTSKVEELLSNKFGAERVDFGVFNSNMKFEED